MKNILKGIILCFMMAISMGSLYASIPNTVTEAEFAAMLNTIPKVEAKQVVGTNETLTREKAACMIVDFLGYSAIAKDNRTSARFTDVSSSKGEIEVVSQLGIMNGTGDGQFQAKVPVTMEAAQAIVQNINHKLSIAPTWKHACYAIHSSSQMEQIKEYQAVSFGWAELLHTQNGFEVSTTQGSLKAPSGFEAPLDLAKTNGVETYLMIYFEDKEGLAQSLLGSKAEQRKIIEQIVSLATSFTKEGVTRSFDGVTIDFEGLASSELKAPYVSFLKTLKAALAAQNKKLNVAVQPTLYYKGYDYKGIGEAADHMILMAHDYGAKSLTLSQQQSGMTTTPLTPIDDVYLALAEASHAIADPSKIALQFSFASLQWQKQNGVVLNSKAYTPSYDKIWARLQMPGTTSHFDPYSQCSYATYEADGITNVIWYEDAKSIRAKMELAKLLGITNFSYWRLGMIPDEVRGLI